MTALRTFLLFHVLIDIRNISLQTTLEWTPNSKLTPNNCWLVKHMLRRSIYTYTCRTHTDRYTGSTSTFKLQYCIYIFKHDPNWQIYRKLYTGSTFKLRHFTVHIFTNVQFNSVSTVTEDRLARGAQIDLSRDIYPTSFYDLLERLPNMMPGIGLILQAEITN